MSIKLMAAAWELDIPSTEKMVLLCLCDFANDEGKCWPAVGTIATKCSKGERTVQKALASLESMGFLSRKEASGTSTRYYLDPRKICTPAENAPPQLFTQTPAKVAPKPSRTTTKQNKKCAIPANWWPEEFGLNTKSRRIVDGWTADELATQVEAFTAHHRKNGSKFECWQSAWSTWVINSEKFKPRQPANQRGSSLADIGDDVRRMFNG